MQHITGIPREQIQMQSLNDTILETNPVHVVEAFVENIDLDKLGFIKVLLKSEGRPSFESKVFLKIYLYGYLNGIRSSRKLERECIRNIEMQWLLHGLRPNYHSICDFRKVNPEALRNLFKMFVSFLKDAELVAGETIAIDGTKSRAHNSKKNNFNQKKIDRHLAYIEARSEEYMTALESNDVKDDAVKVTNLQEKLERLKTNKLSYELLEQKLKASGEPQISTTDEDARALLVQGQVVEVSYNIQAAVDAKHKLVVATHTINRNDRNALADIALEVKENLSVDTFTALLDKGFHNGGQIQQCQDANIKTIVAYPELVNTNETGTTKAYMVSEFVYEKASDTYTCPQGETLHTKGTWHNKKDGEKIQFKFKQYRTPKCKTCPVKHLCTAQKGGRVIQRSEFADAVEANNKRYDENPKLYRQRQEINEHIFGTIKRQWGYYYTNLKGLEKVNGEHSLIMFVYNLKRTINILGVKDLIDKLKNWEAKYPKGVLFIFKCTYFKPNTALLFFEPKLAA